MSQRSDEYKRRSRRIAAIALLAPVVIVIGVAAFTMLRPARVPDAFGQQQAAWRRDRPTTYRFTYWERRQSGESSVAVSVDGDQHSTRCLSPSALCITSDAPSGMDNVFDRIHRLYLRRVHVTVDYAPDWHYPQQVDVDPMRRAKDDEYSFGVADFEAP